MKKIAVVVGTTGAGKSKLALDLCKRFNGELVSADSLQIYRGLDTITNKSSVQERSDVPHHVIDFLDPNDISFNVQKFVSLADESISEIISRNKLPVICGGTHFYVENLIWREAPLPHSDDAENNPFVSLTQENLTEKTTDELYQILQQIDPETAKQIKQTDKRRILRRLAIIGETGKKCSELSHFSAHEIEPSYDACVFVCDAEKNVLDARVGERCEQMLESGSINEIRDLQRVAGSVFDNYGESTFSKGLFQAIGVREFYDIVKNGTLDNTAVHTALEKMKTNTRKYVRVQRRWIIHRLKKRTIVHDVDTTNPDKWNDILEKASTILNDFLTDGHTHVQSFKKAETTVIEKFCDICGKSISGEKEWNEHVKSKRHRANKRKSVRSAQQTKIQKKIKI